MKREFKKKESQTIHLLFKIHRVSRRLMMNAWVYYHRKLSVSK